MVWQDSRHGNYDIFGRDLYAVNLETGKVFRITTDASDQVSPAVSGKLVVWTNNRDGNADIYGKNLATGEEFRISGGASPQLDPGPAQDHGHDSGGAAEDHHEH